VVKQLTNVTSLTGNGLHDWLIQRITSVVMLVYIVFLLLFFILHAPINYTIWQGLFSYTVMRLLSSLFLLSLIWHAWVGMWTVITDYVKPFVLRLVLPVIIVITLVLYLIWGLAIFWAH